MGSGPSKGRGMVSPKIGRPRPPRVLVGRKYPGQRDVQPPPPAGPLVIPSRRVFGMASGPAPQPPWMPLSKRKQGPP